MPADGKLKVQAFDDWNENALWDAGEPGVADLSLTYAGLDAGNSGVTGTVGTDVSGTWTGLLTVEAYGYDVTVPTGYAILTPVALSGDFTLMEEEDTTLLFPLVPTGTGTDATDPASPVVISQVYGAGGGTGSAYNRDFVELFNRGTTAVNLAGWSVQYAGTRSGTWQVVPLSGTLAAGHYYLVGGAAGPTGAALPTPDASSTADLVSGAGKVALLNTTTPLTGIAPSGTGVADLFGYGHADWYEGTGPAPGTDGASAAVRLGGGNYDSNDNRWDGSAATPAPRNTASAAGNLAPVVTAPGTRTTAINTVLTFSTATGTAITVADPDAGTSALEVSINAGQGTATLATTAGLTFTSGDGTADADMTFTGNLTNIAAALDGLMYTPAANYRGYGGLTVWADDQGNTGAGGALLGYGVASVVVGGPVVGVADDAETAEDTAIQVPVRDNDAWVSNTTPTLTVQTPPAHGTAVVDDNGTPADPSDDRIKYTPSAEYHGIDSLTYQLNDGQGHTDTATVALTVTAVNDARIATSGEPTIDSDEGALENFDFVAPDATEAVTWTATGLPAGITIDATTGHIAGRAEYTQAGDHAVTVTATSASGDTDHIDLTWTVHDTNRIGWLDDQFYRTWEWTNIPVDIHDDIGNPLTVIVSGLPSEFTYDPAAGAITGQWPEGSAGTYTATVQVSGGGATDVRQFTTTVHSTADTAAEFKINGTYVHQDDVGIVGQPMPVAVRLFLPAGIGEINGFYLRVMEYDSNGQLVPSSKATLTTDPTDLVGTQELYYSGGELSTLIGYVIPKLPSTATNDIVLVAYCQLFTTTTQMGAGGANGVQLVIGTKLKDGLPDHAWNGYIDADTTPEAMWKKGHYRIPPRAWSRTSLWVTKTGEIGQGKFVYLVAPRVWEGIRTWGQSDNNGRVALMGAFPGGPAERYVKVTDGQFVWPHHDGETTARFGIRGHVDQKTSTPYQTVPGFAGQPRLGIYASPDDSKVETLGKVYYETKGFSVAAIPIKTTMTFLDLASAEDRAKGTFAEGKAYLVAFGARYQIDHISDSGATHLSDLDEILVSEAIDKTDTKAKGLAKVAIDALRTSGFLKIYDPANPEHRTKDLHAVGAEVGYVQKNKEGKEVPISFDTAKKLTARTMRGMLDNPAVGPGSGTVKQYFLFVDNRTGTTAADAVRIANSGFEITYNTDKYYVEITKAPKGNNGAGPGEMPAGSQGAKKDTIPEVKQ